MIDGVGTMVFSVRRLTIKLSILLLAIAFITPFAVFAQDTPSSTPVSQEPDETVWFVIMPEGKGNGEFFEIVAEPGESVTVRGTFGNGSAIPVKANLYAADVVSPLNGGFGLADSTVPISESRRPTRAPA